MLHLRAGVAGILSGLLLTSVTSVARADVSSWFFAGSGASLLDRSGSRVVHPVLQIDTGLGSSPKSAFVLGGLLRWQTQFDDGTDFGAYARLATRGYVRGAWGLALDLGSMQRYHAPFAPGYGGTLSIGAPWGITLNLDAARDQNDDNRFAAVLGIDFARFSVYRTVGLNWFPNPFPVQ